MQPIRPRRPLRRSLEAPTNGDALHDRAPSAAISPSDPAISPSRRMLIASAVCKPHAVMSSFHNDLKPGVDLALSSLFGHSISFADFPDKDVFSTTDRFQIRLRQSAPPLPDRRLKLSPTAFDLMPVHNMPRFQRFQTTSAGRIGTYRVPQTTYSRLCIGQQSRHASHTPMAWFWPAVPSPRKFRIVSTRNGSASGAARPCRAQSGGQKARDVKPLKRQA